MAIAIDPRPTYFGDRMIITGTYGAGDTTIDLSTLLSVIDMAMCCGTGAVPAPAEVYTIDGTTITLTAATQAGNFMVIGRR